MYCHAWSEGTCSDCVDEHGIANVRLQPCPRARTSPKPVRASSKHFQADEQSSKLPRHGCTAALSTEDRDVRVGCTFPYITGAPVHVVADGRLQLALARGPAQAAVPRLAQVRHARLKVPRAVPRAMRRARLPAGRVWTLEGGRIRYAHTCGSQAWDLKTCGWL